MCAALKIACLFHFSALRLLVGCHKAIRPVKVALLFANVQKLILFLNRRRKTIKGLVNSDSPVKRPLKRWSGKYGTCCFHASTPDESIRIQEGWQVDDAAFCHVTLDTCLILKQLMGWLIIGVGYCVTLLRLLGGCSNALKPSSSRSCYPPCDAEYSFCTDDDRCMCRPGYRPVYKHGYLARCLSMDDANQQSYLIQPELDTDSGIHTQPVFYLYPL